MGPQHCGALVSHRCIGRARRDHQHPVATFGGPPPHDGVSQHGGRGIHAEGGNHLILVGPRQHHWSCAVVQQFSDHGDHVNDRLPRRVDRLGQSLPEGTVVVDAGDTHVGEWEAAQSSHRIVGRHRPACDAVNQFI